MTKSATDKPAAARRARKTASPATAPETAAPVRRPRKTAAAAAAQPVRRTRRAAAAATAPAASTPTDPAAPAAAPEKARKGRKGKVVRDSYSMPLGDYELIATLKKRLLEAGVAVKKSELLRAGLHLLSGLLPDAIKAQLERLESVKTGRPAKNPGEKPGRKRSKKK